MKIRTIEAKVGDTLLGSDMKMNIALPHRKLCGSGIVVLLCGWRVRLLAHPESPESGRSKAD
jgi:hypothetical protein